MPNLAKDPLGDKKRKGKKKKGSLTEDEFMQQFEPEDSPGTLLDMVGGRAPEPPFQVPGWCMQLFRQAIEKDCPDAFRSCLEYCLYKAGLNLPWQIPIGPPRGTPGAPRKPSTWRIHSVWCSLGRPSFTQLAKVVYSAEFAKADALGRHRLTQRARQTIERVEELLKKYSDVDNTATKLMTN